MSRSKTRSSSWNVASASSVEYKGCVLLSSRSLTTMVKPGRNDPCPCGSGNKYKRCCLPKEEAVEREQLAKAEARRAESAAAHRLPLREVKAAIAAILSGAGDAEEDELTSQGAPRRLRPRLRGRVRQTRQPARPARQAADCYRKVIAFARAYRPLAVTCLTPFTPFFDSREQPCCTRDEGWPLGPGLQDQGPNHRKLRRQMDGSGSAKDVSPLQAKAGQIEHCEIGDRLSERRLSDRSQRWRGWTLADAVR